MFKWLVFRTKDRLQKSGGLQAKLKAIEAKDAVSDKILKRNDRRQYIIPEMSLHRRQEDLAS